MTFAPRLSLTTALAAAVALAGAARGQAPAGPKAPAPAQTLAQAKSKRQSVVHHYAYPYPGHYHGDDSAGFRNPGGTGRYLEYYPPGNDFQNNQASQDRVKVAKFDQGGGDPGRAEQIEAQQIGVQRTNAIQNDIDNYSRPYMGYGVGFFGGFY